MANRLRFETVESAHEITLHICSTQGQWCDCRLKINRPQGGDKQIEIKLPVKLESVGNKQPALILLNGDEVHRTRAKFPNGDVVSVDVIIGTLDWYLEGAIISFDWHQSGSILDHVEGYKD